MPNDDISSFDEPISECGDITKQRITLFISTDASRPSLDLDQYFRYWTMNHSRIDNLVYTIFIRSLHVY